MDDIQDEDTVIYSLDLSRTEADILSKVYSTEEDVENGNKTRKKVLQILQ